MLPTPQSLDVEYRADTVVTVTVPVPAGEDATTWVVQWDILPRDSDTPLVTKTTTAGAVVVTMVGSNAAIVFTVAPDLNGLTVDSRYRMCLWRTNTGGRGTMMSGELSVRRLPPWRA